MTFSPTRAKRPSPGTIYQEVFENEPAFSTVQRSAAPTAGKLLVR